MGLRAKNGKWHYRFMLDGHSYSGSTGLDATRQNVSKAQDQESAHRQELREGRNPLSRKVVVREFTDAATDFLSWAKMEYRAHPNSYHRIAASFASAKQFFSQQPVSMIDEGRIEAYKAWRVNEHKVRDVTVRHDLPRPQRVLSVRNQAALDARQSH